MKTKLTAIDDARHIIQQMAGPVVPIEEVGLSQALNRIVAQDILAPVDVPGANNSAMDGFAVNSADLEATPIELPVSQRITAGQVGTELQAGTAARIFTGAPIPEGADAVVMQENCDILDGKVQVLQAVKPGENIRSRGEDIRRGVRVISKGSRISAPDMGVLAASGVAKLEVRKPLTVAILTTGDELVRPGEPLEPGKIYNSNFYLLEALVKNLGFEVFDLGIVADDLGATTGALAKAAEGADCILSSGGVSMGEEDHVRAAVESLGELQLWKLAIKPGKPFAFGSVTGKPFFGLPGNPVSAFVTFALLVKPALLAMGGVNNPAQVSYSLPARFSLPETGERREFLRVEILNDRSLGQGLVMYSSQSSGVGSSISQSDGLAEVPPFTSVNEGDMLKYMPISDLIA